MRVGICGEEEYKAYFGMHLKAEIFKAAVSI